MIGMLAGLVAVIILAMILFASWAAAELAAAFVIALLLGSWAWARLIAAIVGGLSSAKPR